MADRWFISDTHFGHANMLGFKGTDGLPIRRGFRDVEHMDEHMIERWNSVVKPGDTVFHLGDFAMNPKEIMRVRPRLQGKINLVLGNHDRAQLSQYRYFQKVRGWYHFTEPGAAMVCTHCPLHESGFLARYDGTCINVHGHIHARVIPDAKYVNVCVEQTDYLPVHYDTLMQRARKMAA